MIFLKKQNNRGFTLVELMVSTSIFVVIMLMAMGSLLVASDSARKSQALRFAMDNVSFAMEDMSRSLRVGKDYQCVNGAVALLGIPNNDPSDNCPLSGLTGGGAIIFTPPSPSIVRGTAYKLAGVGPYTLQKCDSVSGCLNITAPEVNISLLRFFVEGSSTVDNLQPTIHIIMKGTVTVKGQPTSFAIQTMVTQRSTE